MNDFVVSSRQVYAQARAESLKVPAADAVQFSKRVHFDQKDFSGFEMQLTFDFATHASGF